MDSPKVSIIMPVYNTEEYVAQAVESIMQQTLSDIEIIIINDGSTDGSLGVLEKLAEKDNRIQLYSQPNQGQSVARNYGIECASGKYLYFMDSDDLLESDALEACFNKCETNELDFVFFDASILQTEGQANIGLNYSRKEATNENDLYNGNEVINILLKRYVYSASPCLSVIKADYLKRISLGFYPGIIHEDELFTFQLYLNAERVMCIHRAFFIRRVRQNSTMTLTFSWKNIRGYLTVAEEILKIRKGADAQARRTIDGFLSQMLNAAVWKAHLLSKTKRIYLFSICMYKYQRYVTSRTIAALLFKSYVPQKKNNG